MTGGLAAYTPGLEAQHVERPPLSFCDDFEVFSSSSHLEAFLKFGPPPLRFMKHARKEASVRPSFFSVHYCAKPFTHQTGVPFTDSYSAELCINYKEWLFRFFPLFLLAFGRSSRPNLSPTQWTPEAASRPLNGPAPRPAAPSPFLTTFF